MDKSNNKKGIGSIAQGEQRITFHGERIYDEKYSRRNESIVLKKFKHFGAGRDRRDDYIEIMETQAVAAFLANEFNRIAPKGSKEIQFLHVRQVLLIYMTNVCFARLFVTIIHCNSHFDFNRNSKNFKLNNS